MNRAITATEGVMRLDELKTRQFGANCYVDVEVSVNPDLSLRKAHDIAEAIHAKIESNYPNVKHCTVHINPYDN